MRLQKYLAQAGVASRRKAEKMILQGEVQVNNKIITELGTKIDITKDKVNVNDELIELKSENIYLLLNKPEGYLTTVTDDRGRPTIMDLLKNIDRRVFPVGRLDYNTEGLLIITDDGNLAYRLTHPSYKVEKTYLAKVRGRVENKSIKALLEGVKLEDGFTAPAKVKKNHENENDTELEIIIHEGRKRQVRRMCHVVGHPVIKLKRIKFSFLDLTGVKKGEFRYLSAEEVKRLYEETVPN